MKRRTTTNLPIMGMHYTDACRFQRIHKIIRVGDVVTFRDDPNNPHDPKAIAVDFRAGNGEVYHIGYVSKKDQHLVRPVEQHYGVITRKCMETEEGSAKLWARFSLETYMPQPELTGTFTPEATTQSKQFLGETWEPNTPGIQQPHPTPSAVCPSAHQYGFAHDVYANSPQTTTYVDDGTYQQWDGGVQQRLTQPVMHRVETPMVVQQMGLMDVARSIVASGTLPSGLVSFRAIDDRTLRITASERVTWRELQDAKQIVESHGYQCVLVTKAEYRPRRKRSPQRV